MFRLIVLVLGILMLLAVPAQAMQAMTIVEAPTATCQIDPSSAYCAICFNDPNEGPLPVSTGGVGGIGIGVAADPFDYTGFLVEGGEFGPYTGVYQRTNGC